MTFLNPLMLAGLLAAAIPILLHLFNLRKLRTIEFSTLTFLKELQKTKIRRVKLRQWILLLLRTLLVLLVVLAFARPTLEGPLAGALGERARTTCVLILDDSQSMTYADENGELLKQAREIALRVVELLGDRDEAYVLKLSETASGSPRGPIRDAGLLRSLVSDVSPSFIHAKLEDAMRLAARVLADSRNFNREVYLVSDFQRGAVDSRLATTTGEDLFSAEVRIFLAPVGHRIPHNLGITAVAIPNTLFEVGKTFTVRVTVINDGDQPVQDHLVSLYLNGVRVAQRSVDVEAGSSADVELAATAQRAGIIEGMVEIEDDDLEYDNRRYFTLRIPERIRVLAVGTLHDLEYITLALSAATNADSPLQVTSVTPERLSTGALSNADVVLFSNPPALSQTHVDQLSALLEAGGGVIIFPGPQTTPDIFNRTFASHLQLAPLTEVLHPQVPDDRNDREGYMTFDRVELEHPLFEGMFENETPARGRQQPATGPREVESPRIRTAARFQPPPGATGVITLSNNAPFLLEQQAGSGRVLLFAVSATTAWSDFPLKGIFVSLLHRSVRYLAQPTVSARGDVHAGEEAVLTTRRGMVGRWVVTGPSAGETFVQPVQQSLGSVVRFGETAMPGIYSLRVDSERIDAFAVNIDADESRTAPAGANAIVGMLLRLGLRDEQIHRLDIQGDVHRAIGEARFGVELWRHFLIAAFLVALVETLVARSGRRDAEALTSRGR